MQACLRIVLVVSPGQEDNARPYKAAEVVHMAVDNLVIANHSLPKPDDLLQAQVGLQDILNALSAEVRVP